MFDSTYVLQSLLLAQSTRIETRLASSFYQSQYDLTLKTGLYLNIFTSSPKLIRNHVKFRDHLLYLHVSRDIKRDDNLSPQSCLIEGDKDAGTQTVDYHGYVEIVLPLSYVNRISFVQVDRETCPVTSVAQFLGQNRGNRCLVSLILGMDGSVPFRLLCSERHCTSLYK